MFVLLAFSAGALSLDRDRVVEYRVRSQNLHIDHLEHKVEDLEHAFDELSRPVNAWDVNMVVARVHKNEGRPSVNVGSKCMQRHLF